MAVTEYIGPLVGPVFADPAEWTPTRSYEALNVVLNEGNSYTAKQDVPIGVQITDTDYWLETGNYNAQLEQYRKETQKLLALSTKVNENTNNIATNTSEIKKINEYSNKPIPTKFGYNIDIGGTYITEEVVKQRIRVCYLAGLTSATICVHIDSDGSIKYLDNVKNAIDIFINNNIPYSIKFHNGYNQAANTYINSIFSLLQGLSTKPQIVYVYNEPEISYINSNSVYMISCIRQLQENNYTVGTSFTDKGIFYGEDVWSKADIVGFTFYPSMGYSLTNTIENTEKIASQNFMKITEGIDKPIAVTETGIMPYKCCLFAPATWDLKNGYPPDSNVGRNRDENVYITYCKGMIKALNGCCDIVSLWFTGTLTENNAVYLRGV